MKYIVRVWDCRAKTDTPCEELKFSTWEKAIKYIKNLPPTHGGTVEPGGRTDEGR